MTDQHKLECLINELAASARLSGARDVLGHVVQVRGLLAEAAPAVKLALATARLIQASAGVDFQRFMSDIDRGERVLAGAKAGHEAVYGTPEEKATRYAAYQVAVDEKHKERPAIESWRRLSDLVADDIGCSGWTIRRHAKNPFKR